MKHTLMAAAAAAMMLGGLGATAASAEDHGRDHYHDRGWRGDWHRGDDHRGWRGDWRRGDDHRGWRGGEDRRHYGEDHRGDHGWR